MKTGIPLKRMVDIYCTSVRLHNNESLIILWNYQSGITVSSLDYMNTGEINEAYSLSFVFVLHANHFSSITRAIISPPLKSVTRL